MIRNICSKQGFSLIEAIIGIGIFLLFAFGVYSGSQFVFKAVYSSRIRIVEGGILNEQIEIIRNLPYSNVGIEHGSPDGVLTRTTSTIRDNIHFTITRTIRNIDDPYDGTIGGTPNDIAPADYKLVQVDIICATCGQQQPLSMVTRVGPRHLEGDPTHGALFVEVFDASAVPVAGADVHVVATTTNPTIDLVDTTDNDGMLKLVDLPAGIGAYSVTVSKSGYTTERTLFSSSTNPNPVHPPVSVIAEDVSQVSFSIDRVSSLIITAENSSCARIGSVPVALFGSKLIGTSPDVQKINESFNLNSEGEYTAANLDWDNYSLAPTGYDVVGSISPFPLSLSPGVEQPVQLILDTNTSRSLLVSVRDSITLQPIASTTVILTGSEYSSTKITGVGSIRQTDWSGGSGQLMMTNAPAFYSNDGGIETMSPAGDLKLRRIGGDYFSSGILESSIFDIGSVPNYVNLVWEPFSQPVDTGPSSLRLQIATSDTSTPTAWVYRGPEGNEETYYDSTNPILNSIHNGDRYFRYKVFLSTVSTTLTPVLSDISVSFTNGCLPPGQVYFGNLVNETYQVEAGRPGYATSTITIDIPVSGDTAAIIDLVVN